MVDGVGDVLRANELFVHNNLLFIINDKSLVHQSIYVYFSKAIFALRFLTLNTYNCKTGTHIISTNVSTSQIITLQRIYVCMYITYYLME